MAKLTEIENALTEVADSDIVAKNPEKLTVGEAVFAYVAISHMEKVLDARKEALKRILDAHAQKHGDAIGDKGAVQVTVSGSKVIRERKTAKLPDQNKMKALVLDKGIAIGEAFDEVTVLEMNPSKVQYLIDTGKLEEAEVEALRSVTFSLKVTPSPTVKSLLESAAPIPK